MQTNAPYTIYDGASQVGSPVLVNQELAPTADHVEGGEPFQILAGSVTITSGTLVVELSNAANECVIADAVRIELVAPAGPDATAPTADLSSPADGDSIDPAVLNAQGYIEVTFADSGDGVDASTIDGDELSLGGTGVGTAVLSGGAPTLVSGTTYRYGFTGELCRWQCRCRLRGAGSFADLRAPRMSMSPRPRASR